MKVEKNTLKPVSHAQFVMSTVNSCCHVGQSFVITHYPEQALDELYVWSVRTKNDVRVA